MNFLNIGPMELILIFMLALIILGPRRLPEVARDLGEAPSSFRRATQDLERDRSGARHHHRGTAGDHTGNG